MKKILLIVTCLIFTLNASSQTWSWANSIGGRSSSDGATGLARDISGNVYVCGDFEGTRSFGATSLTAVGLSDLYLSKFNSSGVHQWTLQINGSGTNVMEVGGIAIDTLGNIYLAGNFSYNVILGGISTINPGGNYDGFVAKFTPSGVLAWHGFATGNGNERISDIKSLGSHIYICGSFSQPFSVGTVNFSAPIGGYDDAFIIKMNNSGPAIWGVKGGGNNDDRALSLSVSNNAIYWAGFCNSVATFGGINLNPVGSGSDIFISKLDASGVQLWVKRYGGNFGQQINSVSQDPWGNPICTGNFYGNLNFGTGMNLIESYAMAPAGNGDAFIAKLNGSDGTCSWVRQIKCINGDNNEVSNAASTDPGGSTYITGGFNATTSFATNTAQTGPTLSATNGKDAFLAKYSQTGTLLWVQKIGGPSNDIGKAVFFDINGICTVAGNFGGALPFGSPAVFTINASPGASSVFLAQYSGLSAGLIDVVSNTLAFDAFPNPAENFINVTSQNQTPIHSIELFSVSGARVYETNYTTPFTELKIDISELSSGIYFLKVTAGESQGVKKIQVK